MLIIVDKHHAKTIVQIQGSQTATSTQKDHFAVEKKTSEFLIQLFPSVENLPNSVL